MSQNLQRAIILCQQRRLDLAEKELRQVLTADPDHAVAHSILAMCLADMERYEEATEEARRAVHLGPDLPMSHYAMAYVMNDRGRLEEARPAIDEAIRLEPDSADNFGLLAAIEFKLRDWPAALEAAEFGLRLDPEHAQCTNIRAMALVNLGRKAEAGATIEAVLTRDPENAPAHANMGWNLLHRGEPRKAMEHFREALRLESDMEWARRGIIEAMKARNFIYRWLLAYFLWMGRLSHKAQWGVIIGFYVAVRVLRAVAQVEPRLTPYICPILGLYLVFVVLTWIGPSLFNLLLRLDRFGRLALSRDEIQAANWLAFCLGGALVGVLAYFVIGNAAVLFTGIFMGLMALPVSATLCRPPGWPRKVLLVYTLALAALAITAVISAWTSPQPFSPGPDTRLFNLSGAIFLLGCFVFQWVANAVSMVRVRR